MKARSKAARPPMANRWRIILLLKLQALKFIIFIGPISLIGLLYIETIIHKKGQGNKPRPARRGEGPPLQPAVLILYSWARILVARRLSLRTARKEIGFPREGRGIFVFAVLAYFFFFDLAVFLSQISRRYWSVTRSK